jgi:hypothetical protein
MAWKEEEKEGNGSLPRPSAPPGEARVDRGVALPPASPGNAGGRFPRVLPAIALTRGADDDQMLAWHRFARRFCLPPAPGQRKGDSRRSATPPPSRLPAHWPPKQRQRQCLTEDLPLFPQALRCDDRPECRYGGGPGMFDDEAPRAPFCRAKTIVKTACHSTCPIVASQSQTIPHDRIAHARTADPSRCSEAVRRS